LNKRVYQVVSFGTVPILVVDCMRNNIGLTCEHNSSVRRLALGMMVELLSLQTQKYFIIIIIILLQLGVHPVAV
jgi:hypothetical protein